ncbi:hypothetical protein OHC33_000710 [Knufia fluminis]|uniref:Uncharacterized protein n=1 Tax=Knufia fluminis TaxID=191047 RepID=A0AAN8ICS3_9EURO|nr:hypothetical protein OHC33_000710 [Knufia fluminis]
MCRMCLYYHRIDLEQLSTSNPFSKEYLFPDESPLPNNTIVESPESRRHTAWTNLRRFPSLKSYPAEDSTRFPDAALEDITVRGPRELSKQRYMPYQPFRDQQPPTANQTLKLPNTSSHASIRKLHHHNRVDSMRSIYSPDDDHSVNTSTPKSVSPVSEADSPKLSCTSEQSKPSFDRARWSFEGDIPTTVSDIEVPFPPPLRVRHAEQSPTIWMDQLCQNL